MRPLSSSEPRKLHLDVLFRAVAVLLCVLFAVDSVALAAGPAPDPIQLKQTLMRRGVGKGVRITETDGTVVAGVLTAIHDDAVEITPKKAAQATTIPYAQVAEVRNTGLSKGAKIGIGVVVGVAVAAGIVAIILIHSFHNSFPKTIPI